MLASISGGETASVGGCNEGMSGVGGAPNISKNGATPVALLYVAFNVYYKLLSKCGQDVIGKPTMHLRNSCSMLRM